MQRSISIRIGNSALGTIQLVFIILKLCDVIDWSWWAVFIPLFIELGLLVFVGLIMLIALVITQIRSK